MTTWLIDTSALVRLGASPDAREWVERIDRGLVRLTSLTRLELGFAARTAKDLRSQLGRPPVSFMPTEYATPRIEERAIEIQAALAGKGQHRAPSPSDLMVAATADLLGLTVLHHDKDFELIARVTGQPVERLRL